MDRSLLYSILRVGVVCVLACDVRSQGRDDIAVWPGPDWKTTAPHEVGMDEALLERARDYALTGEGSGLVVRHGEVVMRWGDQKQTYDLKSSTKAIGVGGRPGSGLARSPACTIQREVPSLLRRLSANADKG